LFTFQIHENIKAKFTLGNSEKPVPFPRIKMLLMPKNTQVYFLPVGESICELKTYPAERLFFSISKSSLDSFQFTG
jgi:hypothetical protein